jgi:ribosomal protein L40E
MPSDDGHTCPSCGAYASSDADRCELCGTSLTDDPSADGPGNSSPGPSGADDESAEAPPPGSGAPAPGGADDETPDDETGDAEAGGAEAGGAEAGGAEAEGVEGDAPEVYCNQCGWQNPPGARFCSRCGAELQSIEAAPDGPSGPGDAPDKASYHASDDAPEGTRPVAADLPSGGDGHPAAGRTSDASSPDADDEAQGLGQRIGLLVGVSVAVIVSLFFVTLWSQSQDWGSSQGTDAAQTAGPAGPSAGSGGPASGNASPGGAPSGGGPAGAARGGSGSAARGGSGGGSVDTADLRALAESDSTSMPSGLAAQVDSLRGRLEGLDGSARVQTTRELVNLLVGAGQLGKAAVAQRDLARASGDAEQWRRAADLLYRWLQQMQQNGRRRSAFTVARSAAEAYQRVVEENPDDLEARTRMGESFLRTNSPMKGIRAINGVLEDDSTFVPARFQKGLALLQINRLDQAIEEFRKVQTFAGQGTPYHRQAERAITIIEERRGQGGSGSGASDGPSGTPGARGASNRP